MQTRLLIDGELVEGEGSEIEVLDPASGETVANIREASSQQIDAAVRSSEEAFESWSRTTPASLIVSSASE